MAITLSQAEAILLFPHLLHNHTKYLIFIRLHKGKLKAKVLKGDPLSSNCSFEKPERVLSVKKLLAPVDVPRYGASIRCLGTNYPIGKATKPPVPILFL